VGVTQAADITRRGACGAPIEGDLCTFTCVAAAANLARACPPCPDDLPRLAGLADRWPTLTSQDTYAQGLRALIDGALPESVSRIAARTEARP
jgi:hypothetical protein